jgi:hypothetical protein
MINYTEILSVNYPNSEWVMSNNDYSTLQWHSNTPKPTQSELDALSESTKKQLDFIRNRAKAYPSIVDQLDTLYHGGFDAWKAQIQEVKDQYPKP